MSLIHVLHFTLGLRCSFESDPETRVELICSLVKIFHATFAPDHRCLCPTHWLGGLIIDWAESQESQPAEQQRLVLVRQESGLPPTLQTSNPQPATASQMLGCSHTLRQILPPPQLLSPVSIRVCLSVKWVKVTAELQDTDMVEMLENGK